MSGVESDKPHLGRVPPPVPPPVPGMMAYRGHQVALLQEKGEATAAQSQSAPAAATASVADKVFKKKAPSGAVLYAKEEKSELKETMSLLKDVVFPPEADKAERNRIKAELAAYPSGLLNAVGVLKVGKLPIIRMEHKHPTEIRMQDLRAPVMRGKVGGHNVMTFCYHTSGGTQGFDVLYQKKMGGVWTHTNTESSELYRLTLPAQEQADKDYTRYMSAMGLDPHKTLPSERSEHGIQAHGNQSALFARIEVLCTGQKVPALTDEGAPGKLAVPQPVSKSGGKVTLAHPLRLEDFVW
ncbi:MAG: hypothetical protein ACKVOH_03870 [Chlamydiales bacterium]